MIIYIIYMYILYIIILLDLVETLIFDRVLIMSCAYSHEINTDFRVTYNKFVSFVGKKNRGI